MNTPTAARGISTIFLAVMAMLSVAQATTANLFASMNDALDLPESIAAAPDGGVWVGYSTDTIAGLSYFPPGQSASLEFMAWVLQPSLAVDENGDLFVGGASDYNPIQSRVMHFAADGAHQRSWSQRKVIIADIAISPEGDLYVLQADSESEAGRAFPSVGDEILRYSQGELLRDTWSMEDWLSELAVADDGRVYVASETAGRSWIQQLRPDGSRTGDIEIQGRVVGMGFGAGGRLFAATVTQAGAGSVSKIRVDGPEPGEEARWKACHEPRDITVAPGNRIHVLAVTPIDEERISMTALCEYDEGGTLLSLRVPPMFAGPVSPTATPGHREVAWLPVLARGR